MELNLEYNVHINPTMTIHSIYLGKAVGTTRLTTNLA